MLVVGSDGVRCSDIKAYLPQPMPLTSVFFGSNLIRVRFVKSKAMYTDFSNADLSSADMTDANITGAIFKGARLDRTVMLCQGLDDAKLNGAFYSDLTIWPEEFDPTQKGTILKNG